MQEIVIVHSESGDRQGLYAGGKLMLEKHSLTPGEVLFALNIRHDEYVADQNWLQSIGGYLPKNLHEVRTVL